MSRVGRSPEQKGRVRLLTAIGKEIAGHEAALVELRATKEKLIKLYERSKYADEVEMLRAALKKFEGGL